jgi:hypothetical protein
VSAERWAARHSATDQRPSSPVAAGDTPPHRPHHHHDLVLQFVHLARDFRNRHVVDLCPSWCRSERVGAACDPSRRPTSPRRAARAGQLDDLMVLVGRQRLRDEGAAAGEGEHGR